MSESGRTSADAASTPSVPDVLAGLLAEANAASLAAKAARADAKAKLTAAREAIKIARATAASFPKQKIARDYVREVDLKIIALAGDLLADVPEQFRAEVATAIANQLHHLSNPKTGWPSKTLPTPDRSDWR